MELTEEEWRMPEPCYSCKYNLCSCEWDQNLDGIAYSFVCEKDHNDEIGGDYAKGCLDYKRKEKIK